MKAISTRRKAFMDYLTQALDLLEGGSVNSSHYKDEEYRSLCEIHGGSPL